MPLKHTRTFRIRYYECDAYGHLNNTNYLRFMQETASDASKAGGYGRQRYAEMERMWWVRESEIEYILPVMSEEVIEVTTWIADFRRASCRRVYEFRSKNDGDLVARGHSDWVFLNSVTGQAATIPAELVEAFYPEGSQAEFPPRRSIPAAPPPPAGVFHIQRHVEWEDIDVMKHVNNAVYLSYVSECGMQVIAAHGWPWQRMADEGFGIYLRRNWIRYMQPAFLDDELDIATWASVLKRTTAIRYYHITRPRDQASIAWVHADGVWVDLASRKPIRIPAEFIKDFAPNLV
jgi:acyl-CoA thioester hydrolase